MAAAATLGRKKRDRELRETQYFEPGVRGRKTGITIPQNKRDEHGIEDLDGIFSSPEKPPASRVLRNGNTTLTSSNMDVEQSSAPDPTEVLSTRRNPKTVFPPPMGRSPIKTNIGSSPRRQSSAAPKPNLRQISGTPDGANPRLALSRRLNFTADDENDSAQSLLRNDAGRKPEPGRRKDIYELEATEEEDEPEIDGFHGSSPLPPADDSLQLLQDDDLGAVEDLTRLSELPQTSSPSRLRKGRANATHPIEESHVESEPEEVVPVPARRGRGGRVPTRNSRGGKAPTRRSLTTGRTVSAKGKAAQTAVKRGAKANGRSLISNRQPHIEDRTTSEEQSVREPSYDEPEHVVPTKSQGKRKATTEESILVEDADIVDTTELDDSVVKPTTKRNRGRPPKDKDKVAVHEDTETYEEEYGKEEQLPRPAKRAKKAVKGPKERDPNVQMRPSPLFKKPALPSGVGEGKRFSESNWNTRSVSRLRDLTPIAEITGVTTRSGRTVNKPLNWHMGEKSIYARDGTKMGVVTAEAVSLPPIAPSRAGSRAPSLGPRAQSKSRKSQRMQVIEEDREEEDELEDWEARGDILAGTVFTWDPILGTGGQDVTQAELAWGINSMPVNPAQGGNFGFAKLLSQSWFGTGILDVPVDGFKNSKNSRRMSMHFFVHTGKVSVVVADEDFIVSAGGSWHVPRGNSYEIRNHGTKPARIFFAQGCEVIAQD